MIDRGSQPETGAHRLLDATPVEHGQHPGHCRIDERHVIIGRSAIIGRRAGKQLGARENLSMDLHAHDYLPIGGGALYEIFWSRISLRKLHFCHISSR
jgi:hypothetical protein